LIGLGNSKASIRVYIENPPPLEQYQNLASCHPMQEGEIRTIAEFTGNHWRKIFNVYAKLIYQLAQSNPNNALLNGPVANFYSWQDFREEQLLQLSSDQCLLFSKPECKVSSIYNTGCDNKTTKIVNIIMGRTYAKYLADNNYISIEKFTWLSPEFAINKENNVIICPYFDYRQLSNIKIETLAKLIISLKE